MSQITYLTGDATQPQSAGPKLIVHVCNDIGGWGRGFVVAISRRWKAPEAAYRTWYAERDRNDFGLGAVQFVPVEGELWVGNMVAQHDVMPASSGAPPIRYAAVESCLQKVAEFATQRSCSVHMPRIGCGLAGGKWEEIEPLITLTCAKAGIPVYVYDLP